MSDVLWAPSKPDHWDGASLRWLADIFAGGTPDKDNLDYWINGTIPWLNSGSVNDWIIHEPSAHITRDAYAKSSAKWIPSHSIVMALAGQGKTKGTAARLEIGSTCNQSMAAIVPSTSLDYRFLHFWLASNYQNIRNLAGGDKRDGLNLVHVGGIKVPLPPVGEQRAIADYLDRETQQIDELITEQRGLVETLRERRQAVITRAVTTGLREHRMLQEVDEPTLMQIPSSWKVVRIKSVGRAIIGLTYSPEDIVAEGEGRLVLRSGNIQKGNFSLKDNVYVGRTVPKDLEIQLGDIVICARNGSADLIGKNAVAPEELVGETWGAFMAVLRTDINHYLRWVLNSEIFRAQTGLFSTSTINQLTSRTLHNLKFGLPPADEQSEISAYLDDQTAHIDELISESEDLIALSQERRAALITAAVTGQIDVGSAA